VLLTEPLLTIFVDKKSQRMQYIFELLIGLEDMWMLIVNLFLFKSTIKKTKYGLEDFIGK